MQKFILGLVVALVLGSGMFAGCDSVKQKIDDFQGKNDDKAKEQEKLAAEKRAAEEAAKKAAEAEQAKKEAAKPEPAKKEEPAAEAVAEKPVDDGLIEKDFNWSTEETHLQAQKFIRPLFAKSRDGYAFFATPSVLTREKNVYTVSSEIRSQVSVANAWTWTYLWKVIYISKGGVPQLDRLEINDEPYYVGGKQIKKFTGKAPSKVAAKKETKAKEPKIVDTEAAKAAAEANRPAAAASILKNAKTIQASGNEESARSLLRKVVDRYPETPAAAEARTLLGEPQPPASAVASTAQAESVAAQPDSPSGVRKWTDKSGKHTIEASLISNEDGKVSLKKTDGKVVTFAIDKLCDDDQEFLRQSSGTQ